jgi:hypothetical protein
MTSDGTALIARIDAAERATLLGRQRAAELESTKKGLQLDLVKLTAANTRQQRICRELQQAMKALGGGGGEGNAEEEDEATRRDELASKFDNTIGDIGDIGERMGGQEAEIERLVADNERSSARLASFRSQHEAVVKHQAAEAHTRDLQVRLAAAQLCEAEQHLHEQAQRCRLTEVHLQSQRAAEEDARGQVVAYPHPEPNHSRAYAGSNHYGRWLRTTRASASCTRRSRRAPRSSRSFESRRPRLRCVPRSKTP